MPRLKGIDKSYTQMVVEFLVRNNVQFSAFDVTSIFREEMGRKIRHCDVRSEIEDIYRNGDIMQNNGGYCRDLSDGGFYVYHPLSSTLNYDNDVIKRIIDHIKGGKSLWNYFMNLNDVWDDGKNHDVECSGECGSFCELKKRNSECGSDCELNQFDGLCEECEEREEKTEDISNNNHNNGCYDCLTFKESGVVMSSEGRLNIPVFILREAGFKPFDRVCYGNVNSNVICIVSDGDEVLNLGVLDPARELFINKDLRLRLNMKNFGSGIYDIMYEKGVILISAL